MARDAFGNYTLPGTYLAVTGNTILAAQHNDPLEDLASEMTDSLSRSGAGGMSADLAMGSNKITGLGTAAAGTDALSRDAGDARYLPLAGGSLTGGIDFGSTAAGDPDDLSDHIALYGSDVGFAATSTRLYYNVGSSGRHSFYRGGTLVAEVTPGGTSTVDENTIITREKGDARYVELSGDTMTGDLAMGGNQVTAVGDPVTSNNAMPRSYADNRYLRQIGGTMTGSISMSGYDISGLPNPANGGSHAMSRDTSDARYVKLSGGTMSGDLSLGGNQLTAVGDPVTSNNAMPRSYADTRYLRLTGGSLTGGIDFGSTAASSVDDLSDHIALYGSDVGFAATSTRIYYNVSSSGRHSFYRGGSLIAEVAPPGSSTVDDNTIITREKGDARYIPNDMDLASWSAASGTSYQNTTEAMQFVMAELYYGDTVELSSDGSSWTEVAKAGSDQLAAACVPVPPDWYYRFPGGTNDNKRKVLKTAL